MRITLAASAAVDRLDVFVRLPPGLEVADGDQARSLRLARGERRELELTLRAERWGAHRLGPVYLRARDPLGLLVAEGVLARTPEIRVYPREDTLRRILQPRETQVFTGSEVARRKGEGIEFADMRLVGAGRSARSASTGARPRAAARCG